MVSDSPPDRELEWTDEGIQSSKNLVSRIERFFQNNENNVDNNAIKSVEKFVYEMEENILSFSLNKCIANIYTLFNFLEKNKTYLSKNELSKKVLISLYPIIPRLSGKIYEDLFNTKLNKNLWPNINMALLEENEITLPIQINGKMISTIDTVKDYKHDELLKLIYKIDKVKNKISEKKILKVINVQNKIINIIIN